MRDLVASALASAEVLFTDFYSTEDMIRNGVGVTLTEKESKLLNRAMDLLAELDNTGGWKKPEMVMEARISVEVSTLKQTKMPAAL